jgi:hypothetical protein
MMWVITANYAERDRSIFDLTTQTWCLVLLTSTRGELRQMLKWNGSGNCPLKIRLLPRHIPTLYIY